MLSVASRTAQLQVALEEGADILVASPGDHLECCDAQWKPGRGSGTEWLGVHTLESELPFLSCGLRQITHISELWFYCL